MKLAVNFFLVVLALAVVAAVSADQQTDHVASVSGGHNFLRRLQADNGTDVSSSSDNGDPVLSSSDDGDGDPDSSSNEDEDPDSSSDKGDSESPP